MKKGEKSILHNSPGLPTLVHLGYLQNQIKDVSVSHPQLQQRKSGLPGSCSVCCLFLCFPASSIPIWCYIFLLLTSMLHPQMTDQIIWTLWSIVSHSPVKEPLAFLKWLPLLSRQVLHFVLYTMLIICQTDGWIQRI